MGQYVVASVGRCTQTSFDLSCDPFIEGVYIFEYAPFDNSKTLNLSPLKRYILEASYSAYNVPLRIRLCSGAHFLIGPTQGDNVLRS